MQYSYTNKFEKGYIYIYLIRILPSQENVRNYGMYSHSPLRILGINTFVLIFCGTIYLSCACKYIKLLAHTVIMKFVIMDPREGSPINYTSRTH